MTDRELMQEALYALTYVGDAKEIYSDTIESLRARLAQPEQQHSEQWWKHEVSNAWAEGYEKGRASVKQLCVVLSKECYERGCAAYDDRVDEGVMVPRERNSD